jgi:Nuclear cap-binding protein subunit 3
MGDSELDERLYNPPPETARANAILFHGDPISVLPTQRVLSYAASTSGTPPLGLEWVNDTKVVVIWETAGLAKRAYVAMRVFDEETLEVDVEPEDEEGFVAARPVPETLWPMDARLQKVLGKDAPGESSSVEEGIEVVKRPLRMRWARTEDMKEKGAKNKSKFYERHGSNAGKEGQNVFFAPEERTSGGKRRREDWEEDEEEKRRRLDEGT